MPPCLPLVIFLKSGWAIFWISIKLVELTSTIEKEDFVPSTKDVCLMKANKPEVINTKTNKKL